MIDLEHHLKRLSPLKPSPGLRARLEAELRPRRSAGRSPFEWLILRRVPGLVVLAVLILGWKIYDSRKPAPEAASLSYRNVPIWAESGILYQTGEPPMRVTSVSSTISCRWRDVPAGEEITATYPRQQIVLSPIEVQ